MDAAKRDTAFIMTSGAPARTNVNTLDWYNIFEQIGWKSLGMALDTGNTEEARALGASIG